MTYEEFEARYQYDPRRDFLARDGFGAVYKAFDTLREREVVIKESGVNPAHKFSLLREVELSYEIAPHENIARYENSYRFTLGRETTDYAVMPFFKHGNLNTVLTRETLTDTDRRDIATGILEAVAYLHRQGVVHRDLKASNILMDRVQDGKYSWHWVPKITDFGLRELSLKDVSNWAMGPSLAYMAPEQLFGLPVQANVDLWAVGVTLYKLVTGSLPFDSSSSVEVAYQIRNGLRPEQAQMLPSPYREIINRCLVVDIQQRATSADELLDMLNNLPTSADELLDVLADSQAHAMPPPIPEYKTNA